MMIPNTDMMRALTTYDAGGRARARHDRRLKQSEIVLGQKATPLGFLPGFRSVLIRISRTLTPSIVADSGNPKRLGL